MSYNNKIVLTSSKLPPREEVSRSYDKEIVLTEVAALGSLTVWAHEAGIIMRDGKITDVFQEDRRSIPRRFFGGDEVRTFKAYTSPFELVYWLNDPEDSLKPDQGIALGSPVLTSDRRLVTGSIGITFSVMPDMTDLLLRLLGPRDTITRADVANAIAGELQSKVLGLDLHKYTAADLLGSQDLLNSIRDSLEGELHLTFSNYGLQMDNFYVNWGLSHEERERVRQQRHRSVQRITQEENLGAGPSYSPSSKKPMATVRRPANSRKGQVPSRGMRHREFFQPLVYELRRRGFTNLTEAHKTNYQRFGSEFSAIDYAASLDTKGAWVYVSITGSKEFTERVFHALQEHSAEVEASIDAEWGWRRMSDNIYNVGLRRDGSIDDPPEQLEDIRIWMLHRLFRLREVLNPRLEQILKTSDYRAFLREAGR